VFSQTDEGQLTNETFNSRLEKDAMKKYVVCLILTLAFLTLAFFATALVPTSGRPGQKTTSGLPGQFHLSSTTFGDGGQLPLSMVLGPNSCTFVTGGGDQSPELSWSNAPLGTRSFVVTAFDTTASFTHWGMYNILAKTTELPENAGAAESTFGQQVVNDFPLGAEYQGPCPPNNLAPLVHEYVFTVYALDSELHLDSSPPNFPAGGETLYRAMLGHVLQKASIRGFFSSAN
jgi:Raf kinase inhibitor-like YbhB/YbcL family protein